MNIKNRTDIVHQIVEDLLDNDTLDVNNFGDDVEAIVQLVQRIILSHLKDYMIISGTLF